MKKPKSRTSCRPRIVSLSAIRAKLRSLENSGVDLDKIPLEWTIEQLMQLSGEKL